MRKLSMLTIGGTLLAMAACTSAPQLGVDSIDDVIAAMTREEKVRLVIGTGMDTGSDDAVVGETRSIVPGAAGTTYPIPRLGIPSVVLADGPAGLRINPTREGDSATYYCTHFPIGTLLACTWDTALVSQVGRAIGNEVLEYGADVLLAPALNIHRNPLCGRNFEYYSEDPVVSGRIAAAYVDGVQSNGVGTSIKHFAVNNQETNRTGNDARVSQRALREIYLKGFEICVKDSKPWTVMSSYNYVNGDYASESEALQSTLLRDEWGFDGMVMTDWFGGKDAVAQMKAGNDMLQPGYDKQYDMIMAALEDGSLDESVLDRNVRRILEMIVRTPRFNGYKYSNSPDLQAHAAVTRRSAAEGMVLLKNSNKALPLDDKARKVAVYGCTSYDFIAGGTGSGNVNRAYTVSLLEGLRNAGFTTDEELEKAYRSHISAFEASLEPDTSRFAAFKPKPLPDEMLIPAADLARQADEADVALVTVGRLSGEFLDRSSQDFYLSDNNKRLISDVCRAFHAKGKKVVVVMNIGGVVETASWKDAPDAILCAWQGGQEGGNSVVDILTAKATPCGKLTMTFPLRFEDHASSANFPVNIADNSDLLNRQEKAESDMVRLVDYTPYEEDIYVGYRYFDTFGKPVSYPFGYGLSYTSFEYGKPQLKHLSDGRYSLSVSVKNTGDYKGKEVVQLYVAAPDADSANRPAKELKAFAKTRELAPGESQTVELLVDPAELAYFDEDASAWRVTPGSYRFMIGASAADIRGEATAEIRGAEAKVNNILSPKTDIKKLSRI